MESNKTAQFKKIIKFISSRALYLLIGIAAVLGVYAARAAWNDNVSSGDSLTSALWNNLVGQVNINANNANILVSHSQTSNVPSTPSGWTKLWDGYSLISTAGYPGYDNSVDLGSPGSCLPNFRAMPIIECNDPNSGGYCDFYTDGDYSFWLSTITGDNEGRVSNMSATNLYKISRCAVFEANKPILVRHSQTSSVPSTPSGWTKLWDGYSFVGGWGGQNYGGGQDLGSPGSCLPNFRAMPMIVCDYPNSGGYCDFYTPGDYSFWLSTITGDNEGRVSNMSATNLYKISRCAVYTK